MFAWFKNRTELQRLQYDYCKMMKSAYKLALTDKDKSDQIHEKANKLLSQIKKIESQSIF
ncbi:Lacal_2735 family protein [Aquimarina celericrescens]|uniref:Lacal_2735 family protein n=1 Tax=Aquimarina celericrescens TaxID=1964542 RepID=A0ABW5B1M4_9FLAO|nr:Lacal_2735 family protein [Aquimarina celericrescens]